MKKAGFSPLARFTVLGAVVALAAGPLWAEVRKDKDLPKSGTLSSTSQSGQAVTVVSEPFGFDDNNAGAVSPITGSVSREGRSGWRTKVFNNSTTDSYSVRVEVLQRNDRRTVVRRDAYTYTIPPKSVKTELVPEGVGVRGAELNLSEYKNLTAQRSKKRDEDAARTQRNPTPPQTVKTIAPKQVKPLSTVSPPRSTKEKAEWSYSSPRKTSGK